MKLLATTCAILALSLSASQALTLKKGDVIGGDGQVYEGASPELIQAELSPIPRRKISLAIHRPQG